jgi:transposase
MRKILLTVKEQRLYFFTKVVPLLRVGLSIRDISKVLDKTTTTIRTYNKQYGSSFDKYNAAFNGQRNRSIKNRSLLLANNKAIKYYKQIINFIQKGYTQRQISDKLQIDYFAVKNILKRQKDKDNLYIMLQNGLARKEIIRQQNSKLLSINKVSKAELRLKDIIQKYIPTVIGQYEVRGGNSRLYYADIALPEHHIIFEYDGLCWHNEERDRIRDTNLKATGWTTIRFVYNYPPSDKILEQDFLKRLKELDLLHLLT